MSEANHAKFSSSSQDKPNPRQSLIGLRFGRLTVVGRANYKNNSYIIWFCHCDCGNFCQAKRPRLVRGEKRSCGCLRDEVICTHRLSKSPEFRAWHHMKDRCLNPRSAKFHNHGGRGIGIFPGWITSFESFFAHIGKRPSSQHSLERIDNSRGYEPGNVKWATRVEQNRNRRDNRLITFEGVTLCAEEWASKTGINRGTLVARLKRGWPVESALTTRPKNTGQKRLRGQTAS